MKYRESGMPGEQLWNTFFTPKECLEKMMVGKDIRTFVDIGCGYGTFLVPASELISGSAIGIDIDKTMIETCRHKVTKEMVSNIDIIHADISTSDMSHILAEYIGQIDYVSLFNILHCEEPVHLLKKVRDILSENGRIGVIHWKKENTPRGPSMNIRPTPETIIKWVRQADLTLVREIELPPYHFGLILAKSK